MSLLQQAIQLLSEPPGNIVYHLVTLLTLQAVFAIARSHWQRDPTDRMAQRMAWAAGIIFLARIAFLLAGTVLGNDPAAASSLLPPLEQAVNTLTAVLIVWALARHSTRIPRLNDVLLQIVVLIIGIMTIFFVQEWQDPALHSFSYNSSRQATIWGIVQLLILSVGILLTLGTRQLRRSLNPIVVGILLLAHLANFWNYPEILPTDTEIAYWIRLGHLVAFPLWAALAYRRSLNPLLIASQANQPSTEQLRQSLQLSTEVIKATDNNRETIRQAIRMVAKLVDASFVGIALFDEQNRDHMRLYSNQIESEKERLSNWAINVPDWPAFRLAVEQRQRVQLMPNGLGARQLHDWYEEIGIAPLGAMLIQPPSLVDSSMGLLLLAGPDAYNQWSERDKALAEVLADFTAQVLEGRLPPVPEMRQDYPASTASVPEGEGTTPLEALDDDEHIQQLAELETTRIQLQRAEQQAAAADRRARDLAAIVEELELRNQDDLISSLQAEVEALRESLFEAEGAMAIAAAGESKFDIDWVMRTITRYSGDLDKAQALVQSLEKELEYWEQGSGNQLLASLAQELRTPMTSISGYADLLLSERIGTLGTTQNQLLQRIGANAEKMKALLEQVVHVATTRQRSDQQRKTQELVNVQEVVENAVSTIITQLREKNLRLDLDIEDDLPKLYINRNSLSQIVSNLLDNACRSVTDDGHVSVGVHACTLSGAGNNGQVVDIKFLELTVSDSGGGISEEDRRYVFDPQYRADNPLIAGLGDTAAGLAMARTLTEVNGGRIWIDSHTGLGSTFSTLFLLAVPEANTKAFSNGE
jgi:signal transduction histidine kinase